MERKLRPTSAKRGRRPCLLGGYGAVQPGSGDFVRTILNEPRVKPRVAQEGVVECLPRVLKPQNLKEVLAELEKADTTPGEAKAASAAAEAAADDRAFDIDVGNPKAKVHFSDQGDDNIYTLRLSGRACQILDQQWGGRSFYHFANAYPDWAKTRVDMPLKDQQWYVDRVMGLDNLDKLRLINAGVHIVLLELATWSRLPRASVWGALSALSTTPALRSAALRNRDIELFCKKFCRKKFCNGSDSLSNKEAVGFIASVARTPAIAARLYATDWFGETLHRVFYEDLVPPLSMKALLCAANVTFHGAYEVMPVIGALMGSGSPPTVRKMVVEEFCNIDASAFAEDEADPNVGMVVQKIVAMLGSNSRTHIAEDFLEQASSATGGIRLSSSASKAVSHLIQCPAMRSAIHVQATNLTVSGKYELLALIRLHNLCSDKHEDFEKYVRGHAGLFIQKFYIQSDLFRRSQERAWRPGAGDDVGGPSYRSLRRQYHADFSAPPGPAL